MRSAKDEQCPQRCSDSKRLSGTALLSVAAPVSALHDRSNVYLRRSGSRYHYLHQFITSDPWVLWPPPQRQRSLQNARFKPAISTLKPRSPEAYPRCWGSRSLRFRSSSPFITHFYPIRATPPLFSRYPPSRVLSTVVSSILATPPDFTIPRRAAIPPAHLLKAVTMTC